MVRKASGGINYEKPIYNVLKLHMTEPGTIVVI